MIPKSFRLINRKWRVVLCSTTSQFMKVGQGTSVTADDRGFCDPSRNLIAINQSAHETKEDLLHTWYHEFCHALAYARGLIDHDEAEIELMGSLLHQYDSTSKGQA